MELKSVEDTSWLQLFIKNTALCKYESGRIRCDACPWSLRPPSAIHVVGAHLLPKLRCQFVEFLNHGSLKRLGILYLST